MMQLKGLKNLLRLDVRQLEELNADIIGQAIYKDIPAEDEWKVQVAKELIEAKHDTSILPNFSTKEIEVLLDYFTTEDTCSLYNFIKPSCLN